MKRWTKKRIKFLLELHTDYFPNFKKLTSNDNEWKYTLYSTHRFEKINDSFVIIQQDILLAYGNTLKEVVENLEQNYRYTFLKL